MYIAMATSVSDALIYTCAQERGAAYTYPMSRAQDMVPVQAEETPAQGHRQVLLQQPLPQQPAIQERKLGCLAQWDAKKLTQYQRQRSHLH